MFFPQEIDHLDYDKFIFKSNVNKINSNNYKNISKKSNFRDIMSVP